MTLNMGCGKLTVAYANIAQSAQIPARQACMIRDLNIDIAHFHIICIDEDS